jgi:hypothetical protein
MSLLLLPGSLTAGPEILVIDVSCQCCAKQISIWVGQKHLGIVSHLQDAGSARSSLQLQSADAQLQIAAPELLQGLIHLLHTACAETALIVALVAKSHVNSLKIRRSLKITMEVSFR